VHIKSEACDTTDVAILDSTAHGRDSALVRTENGFDAKNPASEDLSEILTGDSAVCEGWRERFMTDFVGEQRSSAGLEKKKQTTVLHM
jgi:hypothetical protein